MSESQWQELVRYCRENRRGTPPAGNILERATLIEVLGMLGADHLERTAPEGEPERTVSGRGGAWVTLPAQPPPPFTPEKCDQTAKELATLVGYLADLPG